jgi:uncharacterized protein UPF0179
MALLTLVPDALAAKGYQFTFVGANKGEECVGCPFQKLCFGLAPGHAYKVTAVRPVTHPCALHEGGRVRAVEVAEVPFAATLERRHLRGTAAPGWSAGVPRARTGSSAIRSATRKGPSTPSRRSMARWCARWDSTWNGWTSSRWLDEWRARLGSA